MIGIFIATRNAHKVAEIKRILGVNVRIYSQLDFPNAPAISEDAATFAVNATRKAEGLASWLAADPQADLMGKPLFVLADDSGLEVDALRGAPGVRSARFAAEHAQGTENSSDAANNAKLLRLLEGVPPAKRTARFRCFLALASLDAATRLFEGTCEGRIALSASGVGGFGYDPLFVPDGYLHSFAEMEDEVKNTIGHRASALAHLRRFLDGVS
jgi:XTP/dITP diphosphohydrolase